MTESVILVRFFVARLRERRGGQVTEEKTTKRAKVLPSPEEVRAKETLSPALPRGDGGGLGLREDDGLSSPGSLRDTQL